MEKTMLENKWKKKDNSQTKVNFLKIRSDQKHQYCWWKTEHSPDNLKLTTKKHNGRKTVRSSPKDGIP